MFCFNPIYWVPAILPNVTISAMNLEKLSPEEKVNLSINMADVCTRICADAIREQNKAISEKELLEKLRARIQFGKQCQRAP